MLKIKLINEQATLNNFSFVEIKEYTPGNPFKLQIQLQDSETKQRLIPNAGANLNAIFQKSDGTELTVAAVGLFADDRSMWKVELNAAQATSIIGSNVKFELDFNGSASAPPVLSNSTDLRIGMAYGVLAKITFDGEC